MKFLAILLTVVGFALILFGAGGLFIERKIELKKDVATTAYSTNTEKQIQTVSDLPDDQVPKETDEFVGVSILEDQSVVILDATTWKKKADVASFLLIIWPPDGSVTTSGDEVFEAVTAQLINCKTDQFSATSHVTIGNDGKVLYYQNTDFVWKDIKGKWQKRIEEMVCGDLAPAPTEHI